MTEIDALKYELKEERKAFEKLHKRHMDLLKQQGELEKENEQLKGEIGYLKAKNGSLEEGLFKKDRCIVKLEEETQQLKDLIIHMGYTIKNENGTITLELKR